MDSVKGEKTKKNRHGRSGISWLHLETPDASHARFPSSRTTDYSDGKLLLHALDSGRTDGKGLSCLFL